MASKHTEYMRLWRAKNAEKNRAYQRVYRAQYYAQHAEHLKSYSRKYHHNHKAEANARSTKYQQKHYIKKGRRTRELHHNWKGESVGYNALHIWITRWRGRPSKCELCGTESAKRFEWANKDHRYRRVLADYFRVCTSCHRRYDFAHGLSKPRGPKSSYTY